ncbi:uncharacterized protein LOC114351296 [Ostrinia furnacalis]|uniref:uncharacterized protein LOC114351296 n=1 Tax=Ostrinia furnacalis TaxID=93504 RepID=UPI00103A0C16|nr:uncharacterized protein LOC114351296 [Ostrinia furnacalis]XP_028158277.1 uncharacterized protein LOC114351296 [Ostrinia furnacalis]
MSSKFNKNGIIFGYIDAFCLVCESNVLTGENEIEEHIGLHAHKNNMNSAQLVEELKEDHILKVKKGYFCMLCNVIFTSLVKVALHVAEKQHKSRLLRRTGHLIHFGEVLIDETAWQGLVEDMCAVCNAEFVNESEHLAEPSHALNLVKNNVEFYSGQIYRKIDDTTFQCITCNTVLMLSDIVTHFEDSKHIDILQNCKSKLVIETFESNDTQALDTPNDCGKSSSSEAFNSAEGSIDEYDPSPVWALDTLTALDDTVTATSENNASKILESVTSFEKNEVNINFENETALCKKCLGNIDFEYNSIESNIEEHKRYPKKRNVAYVHFPCEADMRIHRPTATAKTIPVASSVGNCSNENVKNKIVPRINKHRNENTTESDISGIVNDQHTNNNEQKDDDLEAFAKQNQFTLHSGKHSAFCKLCGTNVPSSFKAMKEHVEGNGHRSRMASSRSHSRSRSSSSTREQDFRKMPTEDYIDELLTIESLFFGHVKIVNDKFCITPSSFHLITENGGRVRCQLCEITIAPWENTAHINSVTHQRRFKKVPVFWTTASEFVREVRPGLFHCGFCNIIEAGVKPLENHFRSSEHQVRKESAKTTLARHRPAIERFKIERFLARMFGRSTYWF